MRLFTVMLLSTLCLGAGIAHAGFEEGLDAARSGDRATAFNEFKQAAEAGDPRAYGKVGASYLYGMGTEQDFVQAFAWFRLAAEEGEKEAGRFLNAAASRLSPEQLEEAEAMANTLIARYRQ